MDRSFEEHDFSIVVKAHGSSRDGHPGKLIDLLAIVQLDGDKAKADAFVEDLKARYIGKPLEDW